MMRHFSADITQLVGRWGQWEKKALGAPAVMLNCSPPDFRGGARLSKGAPGLATTQMTEMIVGSAVAGVIGVLCTGGNEVFSHPHE